MRRDGEGRRAFFTPVNVAARRARKKHSIPAVWLPLTLTKFHTNSTHDAARGGVHGFESSGIGLRVCHAGNIASSTGTP